jgi:hypothetical protein
MELLRSDQIHSQERHQVYRGTIDGIKEEIRSTYLLKISILAANLSTKLTNVDLILAISGYYLNWFRPYPQPT